MFRVELTGMIRIHCLSTYKSKNLISLLPLKRFEKGFRHLGLSQDIFRISWREEQSVNHRMHKNDTDIWVIAKNSKHKQQA